MCQCNDEPVNICSTMVSRSKMTEKIVIQDEKKKKLRKKERKTKNKIFWYESVYVWFRMLNGC